ncbi:MULTISPECIES: hypothetical protein [unclassified Aureimonas]|uniref:DUF4376 domain-containing protein n=1 Tax=unclassified Aureimonas TaxID=2615206 RepID=UPI000A81024C|nr:MULTISPECIES: hypothetical protein [unclassified Aureimonas]
MRIDLSLEEAAALVALASPLVESTFFDGDGLVFADEAEFQRVSNLHANPVEASERAFGSAKRAKSAAVNAKREAIIAAGYHHNFGGTIGTRILDQRGPEDVTSWLALKLMAQDLNSSDQGDTLLPIRDANNSTFSAKSTAVEASMSDMGSWRARILARSWVLKDEITAAADQAALDAIDINDGWPE